jgi:hypothetical protein
MEDRPMELILIHVLLHPLNPLYFYVSEIIYDCVATRELVNEDSFLHTDVLFGLYYTASSQISSIQHMLRL